MDRRRAKRADRFSARNRAAADERRAAAVERAAAEERRAAAAQRAAAEERRAAAAQRAAAEERRAAAAVAAPLPAAPAVAAPATRERVDPTTEQMYKSLWGKPNRNHLSADKIKGRQGLPLPPHAPEIEGTFFELKDGDKTGNDALDVMMEDIFDECYNEIGDKRRELLHSIWKKDKQKEARLAEQLDGLMCKVNMKIKNLFDTTKHLLVLPAYFFKYPALNNS